MNIDNRFIDIDKSAHLLISINDFMEIDTDVDKSQIKRIIDINKSNHQYRSIVLRTIYGYR